MIGEVIKMTKFEPSVTDYAVSFCTTAIIADQLKIFSQGLVKIPTTVQSLVDETIYLVQGLNLTFSMSKNGKNEQNHRLYNHIHQFEHFYMHVSHAGTYPLTIRNSS